MSTRFTCLRIRFLVLLAALLMVRGVAPANGPEALPGTAPLTGDDDLSEQMALGIARHFEREVFLSPEGRAGFWQPDFSSPAAYEKSVAANRARLIRIIGAVESRQPVRDLELVGNVDAPALVAEHPKFTVHAVRWSLFGGVHGEGLLLQPRGKVVARVVAIPDADQTPEVIAGLVPLAGTSTPHAQRLAENGCQVIVPVIIDRSATLSGNARLKRFTNQPHREWIFRQAFTFGRHIIGLEVQKISAAIDWLVAENAKGSALPVGVAGWGEGGLLALYAAAVDTRVDATLVSGYFEPRERIWTEPIYRNLHGLLREFGDAELARLVLPRKLIIEHARAPQVDGPPAAAPGVPARLGASAAPGRIVTPVFAEVAAEFVRAQKLAGPMRASLQFHYRDHERSPGGSESDRTIGPMAEPTLLAFVRALAPDTKSLAPAVAAAPARLDHAALVARQHRQVQELEAYLQGLIDRSRLERDAFLWQQVRITTPDAWEAAMRPYRDTFWNDLNGRLPPVDGPLHPRSRLLLDRPSWRGFEVVFDLAQPGLFGWGYLLLPKDLKPGERRPVVVSQHGGSGVPAVVINEDPATNKAYKAFAVRLVERGFIVFAPHFPWRTSDRFFRVTERKANAVGMTNFAVLFEQHRRLLDWLGAQPWVDPQRIGFYGLSWGGKAAMRVPAVETRYALSICSGDFNEWIWKSATTAWGNSYMYVPEYETLNFNLGMTFGHAEMAALIAPRAFMVERGHDDGVGIDEWVSFEYARVNRLYSKLKIPDRTAIDVFDGGHEIRGVDTFKFLHRQFNWPEPKS